MYNDIHVRAMTKHQDEAFRATLKCYRKNLGINQVELAAKAGISQSALCNFEAGRFRFSSETMARVHKALFQLVGDRAAAVGLFPVLPAAVDDWRIEA
jgi:predicted transcriptional regulator